MGLKIGIIGAGGMARYHIPGFRSAGGEIVAIADPNEAGRLKTAAANGIKFTYPSLEEMLAAHEELEAVSILTPNIFHSPIAVAALDAGKHVFCEKPPALNASEMLAMKNAAEKAGKHLQFNFNNRARPEAYAVREYLNSGEIGRINSAQAVWARRAGIPGFGGWFTSKSTSGGGPVIDLPHMLDLALHFMGYPRPEWVLAQTYFDFMDNPAFKGPWGVADVSGGKTDVESACHGFIKFATGQVLFVRSSWAEMTEREIVSVAFQGSKAGGLIERTFGEDGVDESSFDRCRLFTVEHGRQVNRDIAVAKDESMGRLRSAANFVLAVEGREEPLNSPEEALTLMRIVDALYESASLGEPVKI